MVLKTFFLSVVVPMAILQLPVLPTIGGVSIGLTLATKVCILVAAAARMRRELRR